MNGIVSLVLWNCASHVQSARLVEASISQVWPAGPLACRAKEPLVRHPAVTHGHKGGLVVGDPAQRGWHARA